MCLHTKAGLPPSTCSLLSVGHPSSSALTYTRPKCLMQWKPLAMWLVLQGAGWGQHQGGPERCGERIGKRAFVSFLGKNPSPAQLGLGLDSEVGRGSPSGTARGGPKPCLWAGTISHILGASGGQGALFSQGTRQSCILDPVVQNCLSALGSLVSSQEEQCAQLGWPVHPALVGVSHQLVAAAGSGHQGQTPLGPPQPPPAAGDSLGLPCFSSRPASVGV